MEINKRDMLERQGMTRVVYVIECPICHKRESWTAETSVVGVAAHTERRCRTCEACKHPVHEEALR